jgi:hypothetical protein
MLEYHLAIDGLWLQPFDKILIAVARMKRAKAHQAYAIRDVDNHRALRFRERREVHIESAPRRKLFGDAERTICLAGAGRRTYETVSGYI